MKTAACYIRVSTDDQTEFSPDSQLKLIRDYAYKHDISLIEDCIFIEDGGKSGKNMTKRTEFMRLISLTKQKQKPFDLILVWKFSRFARNQEESIVLKSRLKKQGIEVISISEALPEGPFGSLVERIIEWNDEYYLLNLSGEVKRGMLERASRGLPVSVPPVGYSMTNGQYVPNDDAEYIRGIFNDYLQGMKVLQIARKYGNMGLRTTRGNMPDNRFIEYILRNPVYCGKIRWSKEGRVASRRKYDDPNVLIFEGKHKAIIDDDVFSKVQEKLNLQKERYAAYEHRNSPAGYMLKGLIKCGNCGSTLTRNSGIDSLQCYKYTHGLCNVSHSITISKANNSVINYIKSCVESDVFNIVPKVDNRRVSETMNFEKVLKNEYAKLERIKAAYQSGVDTLEEYKENKAKQLAFIKKIEQDAPKPDKESEIDLNAYRQKVISVLNILTAADQSDDVKNTALRSIVDHIVYKKSESSLEVYFRD